MKLISVLAFSIGVFLIQEGMTQCTTFDDILNYDEVQDSYTIFRYHFKLNELDEALPYWKIVYEQAPALNGRISYIYSNGRELYFEKFKAEQNSKRKMEFARLILQLHSEERACFPDQEIIPIPNSVLKFLN